MYCKYLSKSLNGKIKCAKTKVYIIYPFDCQNCLERNLVRNKPIKKITNKRTNLEKNRFSIFTKNLKQCFCCKRVQNKMDLHEVYGGSNRTRSMINGLVVPLCRKCHSNENIISKLRIDLQKEYEKTHTREEFIRLIGKSYIKED